MAPPDALSRRELGTSGLRVSVVGLGGNTFGPPRLDEAATARVIDAALELGVNFVDTAIVYGSGQSEELIGRCLAGRRDRMLIATKFNFRVPGEGRTADRIVAQAETSLRKLQTDHIDLYQIHMPVPDVPVDELLGALDALLTAGKVRAIGACNYSSWRLAESAHVAGEHGWAAFASVQDYYHLLARGVESEVLPWCRARGTSLLPYHPLGGGFLTGKYREGQPPPPGTRGAAGSGIVEHMSTAANHEVLRRLEEFTAARGRTVGELAIAWLLAEPRVASVIAGVSSPEQIRRNVAAAAWALDPVDKRAVDVIVSGPLGAPLSPERPPYMN